MTLQVFGRKVPGEFPLECVTIIIIIIMIIVHDHVVHKLHNNNYVATLAKCMVNINFIVYDIVVLINIIMHGNVQ